MARKTLKRIWIAGLAVMIWNFALSQQRPADDFIPVKDEFSKMVPYKAGEMIRVDYQSASTEIVGEAIYRTEKQEIHLYFSKAKDTGSVNEAINTLISRLTLPASHRLSSQLRKNTSVQLKLKQQPGQVVWWHKGTYCFLADARLSNKPELEEFLRFFTD